MKVKKDLIHCQMRVGKSNFKSIFVDGDTLQVYDENKNFIGIAERKFGSKILTIKLN